MLRLVREAMVARIVQEGLVVLLDEACLSNLAIAAIYIPTYVHVAPAATLCWCLILCTHFTAIVHSGVTHSGLACRQGLRSAMGILDFS